MTWPILELHVSDMLPNVYKHLLNRETLLAIGQEEKVVYFKLYGIGHALF